MNIFHAIILGLVEGVTEFLPISSTFHLIFASKLLHLPDTDFLKLFEIFIQAGAILGAVILFAQDLIKDKELTKKALITFLPTAAIGFVLYKVIKTVFFNNDLLMIGVFVLVGILFLIFEYLVKQKKLILEKDISALTIVQAVIIGVVQAAAVVPGVSRSGAVMLGMMIFGFKREEAARYSFIVAIPTILAASGYDLLKSRKVLFESGSNIPLLVVGFVVAFASAYVVMKWFISFLKKNSLTSFGIYRIIAAAALVLLGFVK